MQQFTHRTHPRAKSLKITLTQSGEVIVTTPRLTPNFIIKKFVKDHRDWIEKNQQKIHSRPQFGQTKDTVQIFGKTYYKEIAPADSQQNQKIGVTIQDQKIIIAPVSQTPSSIKKSLDLFLRTTAEKYISLKTKELSIKMDLEYKQIFYKQQKTRWGSCSSQKNLNFNWRLVHAPPKVINYVIIHELAHLKHLDHSSAFWNLVKRYDPAYTQHRGWLKRCQLSLD